MSKEIVDGFRDTMSVIPAVCAFALVFGATATKAGLSLFEIMLSSATMFAGASQFVFLEIHGYHAPAWSIVVGVFAVNFRHILYSASLGRSMGQFSFFQKYFAFFLLADPMFAASEQRASQQKLMASYYFGFAGIQYVFWIVFTYIGAVFGSLIENPQALGVDMILPIYFMVMMMGFRKRPNWLPIVVASGIGSAVFYQLVGPPWHISLGTLCGIAAAIIIIKPTEKGDV
ncbi:MAG: AzlC family ABC transporter permease [Rhizobiaceae bacterium]